MGTHPIFESDFDCLTEYVPALVETVWIDGPYYKSMEDKFHSNQAKGSGDCKSSPTSSIDCSSSNNAELINRIKAVEDENKTLKTEFKALTERFLELESRLGKLVGGEKAAEKAAPKAVEVEEEEEDDDIDLFGSDDEDAQAEAEAEKAKRIADYNERKKAKEAKKGVLIAKSSILLDVKPWDDETDMAELEKQVRSIETDGLVWGAGKLVPVGYGIKKLQICCVVEDDKVGTDFLEEEITAFEDFVKSFDIAAFNKI